MYHHKNRISPKYHQHEKFVFWGFFLGFFLGGGGGFSIDCQEKKLHIITICQIPNLIHMKYTHNRLSVNLVVVCFGFFSIEKMEHQM